jgi:hypothetical protein
MVTDKDRIGIKAIDKSKERWNGNIKKTKHVHKVTDNSKDRCEDGGAQWRSWLRHCTRNRKVGVSISDGVIRIFH